MDLSWVGLSWADVAEPLVAGLAGILGVLGTEAVLRTLRDRGKAPHRWARSRTFLRPRDPASRDKTPH